MEEENVQLSKGYKIFLLDDFGFEICTISEVYDNYIILKEHPYQEYFIDKNKKNTIFVEYESGYSYSTHEFEYAIKGDYSENFIRKLENAITDVKTQIEKITNECSRLESIKEFII